MSKRSEYARDILGEAEDMTRYETSWANLARGLEDLGPPEDPAQAKHYRRALAYLWTELAEARCCRRMIEADAGNEDPELKPCRATAYRHGPVPLVRY